ncbi:MAG TPA: condensation domain-containing protein, partial [Thermoanaerobaculia bacterium]|nr:condensation domain-containing protein [Thermoanaerobaculia bacterium]
MSDLAARISALSPEKQRLLARIRQDQKGETARPKTLTEPFSLVSPADRERLPPGLEDAYPLSMVQLGMLFHMQLTPDAPTPTYHNVNSFNLRVPFDAAALEEAAQILVARHPILRTSFDLTGYSEPLQLVHRSASLPIAVEDLRHLPAEEQARAIESFILEENRRLVDLTRPPLIRFHVHRRSDRGIQFTLTEPHAISDGWSTMSNLSEVFSAYFALLSGEPVPVEPPISSTYRDFVFLERQVLRSEEARQFWRRMLGDWEMPQLPRWRSRAAGGEGFGGEDRKPTFGMPTRLVEGLERLARSSGLPFKSLLLAVHLKVMGMVTGREDAVTGITSHGRPEDRDGERVRGLFLNTIPLRVSLAGGSWLDLARRALQAETGTLPFRRYPLAALQQLCGGRELFEVNFTYLHFHNVQGVVGNEKLGFAFDGHSDLSVTNFPLAVTLIRNPVAPAGLTLTLERNDPGISPAQVRALYGWYERALAAMVADPGADHGSCALLSPAERQQVLAEWNDTAVSFDTDALIHEAFERRAAAAPEALAVVGEDGRRTYGEVEARANRLARHLAGLGVGPGSMVGIYLERSVEMVPALLAVLKAGGAYVPLSDSFPPARMEWILASLDVRHLLTQTPRLPVARALQTAVPGLAHLVCVDMDEADGLPSTPLGRRAGAEDLAYVIFTSGSTGRPKGVAVRHRPVANLVEWALR